MIHPFDSSSPQLGDGCYHIVAWEGHLPAFDPLPMLKTVLLKPSFVKLFNQFSIRFNAFLVPLAFVSIAVRIATFTTPAPVGRVLAPIAVLMQFPATIFTAAHFRTEYVKLLLQTFDFWFLQAANTLWAFMFSIVLSDSRVILVLFCWLDFMLWLLQEAFLKNSRLVVGVAFCQWMFYVILTTVQMLDLVDGVKHFPILTARGRALSTKDVLVNVIVTMTMLSLRNLYRRYQQLQHKKKKEEAITAVFGYRCKISLGLRGPQAASIPQSTQNASRTISRRNKKYSLLQMRLAAESDKFDPKQTVYPRIGTLTPLSTCKVALLYLCGGIGGWLSVLLPLLPRNIPGAEFMAVAGLLMSVVFCAVYICCCQCQLLKRVLTSFHFLFLEIQMITAVFCVADMFHWQWVSTWAVMSNIFLSAPLLTADALTPVMKHRLHFKHWMAIQAVAVYVLVHGLLLLDAFIWGHWNLQDRVFLDLRLVGQRARYRVVPFLLSRFITTTIWSLRNVYISLTRPDDNALILLRGNLEFDFKLWKNDLRGMQ